MIASLIRAAATAAVALCLASAAEAAPQKKQPERSVFDVTRMAPLTDKPGDPANGKKLVRTKGLCLSCHTMPIPEEADHGDVAPDLAGVGSRMGKQELRLRIVDPKILNPDTMMPAFHKTEGLNRVMKKWAGKPILEAQEVEDVVAYLATLK